MGHEQTLSLAWDEDKGPSDEQIRAAKRILRADYWTSIRGMAKDVVDRIKSGELSDEDEVRDYVHETVGGCHWVIYTHANYHAIMASDHDPFEDVEDQGGELDPQNAMPVLAFHVVHHDVLEQIEAELGESIADAIEARAEVEDEDEDEDEDDKADCRANGPHCPGCEECGGVMKQASRRVTRCARPCSRARFARE